MCPFWTARPGREAVNASLRCPYPTPPCESPIEHNPCRSVVARVFLSANPPVDAPVDQSLAHGRREKEMIQAHPLV
jgi:hypothetical protein